MKDPQKNVKRMQRSFVMNIVLLVVLLLGGGWYFLTTYLPEPEQDVWGDDRDLTTPAGRLVGHWRWTSHAERDQVHFYFTPVDREGRGQTILQYPDGIGKIWDYRIISESRDTWQIKIECFNGQKMVRRVELTIPDRGRKARYEYSDNFGNDYDREMIYLGTETEP